MLKYIKKAYEMSLVSKFGAEAGKKMDAPSATNTTDNKSFSETFKEIKAKGIVDKTGLDSLIKEYDEEKGTIKAEQKALYEGLMKDILLGMLENEVIYKNPQELSDFLNKLTKVGINFKTKNKNGTWFDGFDPTRTGLATSGSLTYNKFNRAGSVIAIENDDSLIRSSHNDDQVDLDDISADDDFSKKDKELKLSDTAKKLLDSINKGEISFRTREEFEAFVKTSDFIEIGLKFTNNDLNRIFKESKKYLVKIMGNSIYLLEQNQSEGDKAKLSEKKNNTEQIAKANNLLAELELLLTGKKFSEASITDSYKNKIQELMTAMGVNSEADLGKALGVAEKTLQGGFGLKSIASAKTYCKDCLSTATV